MFIWYGQYFKEGEWQLTIMLQLTTMLQLTKTTLLLEALHNKKPINLNMPNPDINNVRISILNFHYHYQVLILRLSFNKY